MEQKIFSIIGGDKRNIELARLLRKEGHTVNLYGFNIYDTQQYNTLKQALEGSNCVIGPIPCSFNGHNLNAPFNNEMIYVKDLFEQMKANQIFLAGVIKPEITELAQLHNIKVIDMLQREELLVKNAIPTAEGAIKIAIEETDITLHGNTMMVIGYGRIGKVLAMMLRGMGAKVLTVVNNQAAAAQAESYGHEVIPFVEMEQHLKRADVIFNTVPEILLNAANMANIHKSTLLIDLASPPYGIEVNDSRRFGLNVLYTSSLPGKIAPISSAGYLLSTINNILKEGEPKHEK